MPIPSAISGLARRVAENRRDAARIAVQTIVAAVAIVLAMRWLGLPDLSWAVVAGLYVMHVNADSTLGEAGGRIVGTVLGTGLGLALIAVAGEADQLLLRLAVAAAVMNVVGALWPSLRYGVVPAAVIVIEQQPGITAEALHLALAIFAGTALGALTSLLVWPELGRRRALRHLVGALQACRDLLETSLEEVLQPRDRQMEALHASFLHHTLKARDVAAETRLWPRLAGGASFSDVIQAVERLWHSLLIVDRIVNEPAMRMGPDDLKAIEPQARKVERSASYYIDSLVSLLSVGERSADHGELARRLSEAQAISDRLLDGRPRDSHHDRAIQALLFAIQEICKNLAEIDQLVSGAERRRADMPWWRRPFAVTAPLR